MKIVTVMKVLLIKPKLWLLGLLLLLQLILLLGIRFQTQSIQRDEASGVILIVCLFLTFGSAFHGSHIFIVE